MATLCVLILFAAVALCLWGTYSKLLRLELESDERFEAYVKEEQLRHASVLADLRDLETSLNLTQQDLNHLAATSAKKRRSRKTVAKGIGETETEVP